MQREPFNRRITPTLLSPWAKSRHQAESGGISQGDRRFQIQNEAPEPVDVLCQILSPSWQWLKGTLRRVHRGDAWLLSTLLQNRNYIAGHTAEYPAST
jgi:hypothetical protein